ncbi:hypothetical protein JYQ83_23660 (plasmid) [Klebsiella pneumoniae]|nr:hypothetical protein [Klebsiella pneumoniae]
MTAVLKKPCAHIESMLAQHRFQVAQLALHNSPNRSFVRYLTICVIAWYKSLSMKLALLMLDDARYLLRNT